MSILKYFKLKQVLTDHYGYSKTVAAGVLRKIRHMDPELQREFYTWFQTGEMPDHYVNGLDLDALINHRGMNPVSAFLFADWYGREPQEASRMMGLQFKKEDITEEEKKFAKEIAQRLGIQNDVEEDTADIVIPND